MDIFEISLSELTDKYIEYLNEMQNMDMEIATEFLVMASTLLYIKSKKLLPIADPEPEEECEITEEELLEKIAKYKMYKEMQPRLREMYNNNFGTFEKMKKARTCLSQDILLGTNKNKNHKQPNLETSLG